MSRHFIHALFMLPFSIKLSVFVIKFLAFLLAHSAQVISGELCLLPFKKTGAGFTKLSCVNVNLKYFFLTIGFCFPTIHRTHLTIEGLPKYNPWVEN